MSLKKILLVEDDELTKFMMCEMLDLLGYEVLVAEDGDICIDMIGSAADEVGLVLMDINMPRMSGLEATDQIRRSDRDPPRNLPIIAVTADVHWQDNARCRENGFSGMIPKPIVMDVLDTTIRQHSLAA